LVFIGSTFAVLAAPSNPLRELATVSLLLTGGILFLILLIVSLPKIQEIIDLLKNKNN